MPLIFPSVLTAVLTVIRQSFPPPMYMTLALVTTSPKHSLAPSAQSAVQRFHDRDFCFMSQARALSVTGQLFFEGDVACSSPYKLIKN
jgi:hypothetical protein